MCLKNFLWNFKPFPIYKGRKLFFSGRFFLPETAKRGCHTRNMLAKLFTMNNYYFDTLGVGQSGTLGNLCNRKGVRGMAELCSKKPRSPRGWRRRTCGWVPPNKKVLIFVL